jgi:hypothetical protein
MLAGRADRLRPKRIATYNQLITIEQVASIGF